MDLNEHRLDENKEIDGVWVPLDTTTEIKVARFLNTNHRKYINKAMEPYRKLNRAGKVPEDVSEKIEIEAIAKTILLDWSGLTEKGKEVKYSTEEAVRILSNKKYSWFLDFVRETANDMELYNEEVVAEGEENIKKLSTG